MGVEPDHSAGPVTSATYRWAILKAMAGLHDYHARSKVDAIRRRAIEMFAGKGYVWNEGVFLQTLKNMKADDEIELHCYSLAEISPSFKKRIAQFAEHRIEIDDPSEEVMSDF